MQLVGRSFERAFDFRNATQHLYDQCVSAALIPTESLPALPSSLELAFEPINLQDKDIANLVSQCEIDHSIGPVSHTYGGSVAGYRRWQAFKDNGLSTYDHDAALPVRCSTGNRRLRGLVCGSQSRRCLLKRNGDQRSHSGCLPRLTCNGRPWTPSWSFVHIERFGDSHSAPRHLRTGYTDNGSPRPALLPPIA